MWHTLASALLHQTAVGPVYSILIFVVVLPLVNEFVNRFRGTRAGSLLQGMALAALKLPGINMVLSKLPGVGELLYALAPKDTRAELPRPLLKVALDARAAAVSKVAAWLLLALLPASLAACAFCQKPENAKAPECIALNVITDCGAPEVVKIVTDIIASVGQAIASNNYANLLDAIVVDLRNRGTADPWGVITCAINQVNGRPSSTKKLNASYMHGEQWKSDHPAKVKNPYYGVAVSQ